MAVKTRFDSQMTKEQGIYSGQALNADFNEVINRIIEQLREWIEKLQSHCQMGRN